MQCDRGRQSVRLSVCHTRASWQNQTTHCGYFDTTRKGTLVFWHQQWLVDDAPSVQNLRSKWPTPFETRRLRQITAYNVSTVRDSEKVRLRRTGSRPRAFQPAADGRYLSVPQRVAQKAIFCFFKYNIQLQSNEVCYKVSLCENVQRHSCRITIPLCNCPEILARNVTLQLKI